MNRNKTGILLFVIMVLFISCSRDRNTTHIQIKFIQPIEGKISLYRLTDEKAIFVDSVMMDGSNQTELIVDVSISSYYILRYFANEKIYLILHPGDHIEVEIDNQSAFLSYITKGSSDCKLIRDLVFEQEKTKEKISRLTQRYEQLMQAGGITAFERAQLDSTYETIFDQHRAYSLQLINEHPQSLACIFALYQDFGINKSIPLFDRIEYYEVFLTVDSILTFKYPKADAVRAINRDVALWKEQQALIVGGEVVIEPGQPIGPVTLRSITNDTIQLTDYKGAHVALYFFACWNAYSLNGLEQMNQISAANSKKLKVIGISLDSSVEILSRYLSAHRIKLPVVCDGLYWESPYVKKFDVKNLPYIVFIDEEGYIESATLRIDEIEAQLNN